ncbi:hypothetical protein Hanom_Chr08g00752901 [Helianthus anomalus]
MSSEFRLDVEDIPAANIKDSNDVSCIKVHEEGGGSSMHEDFGGTDGNNGDVVIGNTAHNLKSADCPSPVSREPQSQRDGTLFF